MRRHDAVAVQAGCGSMSDVPVTREIVDDVAAIRVAPSSTNDRHQIALFLPYLGGTKEDVADALVRLADNGFTAISFDPWRLGERGDGNDRDVITEVFSHFRRNMWPILGHTTLDAMHLLDWAVEHFDVRADAVVAGGLSMGGDISVALAGIDRRVTRVAAVGATPEWTRPGMTRVGEADDVIDQGEATPFGAWLYDQLNPASHLHRYARDLAIDFELGERDTHVPPASAVAFRGSLTTTAPATAEQMRVALHPGFDHLDVVRDSDVLTAALAWMSQP